VRMRQTKKSVLLEGSFALQAVVKGKHLRRAHAITG
jgi:hypothetical protein